MALVNGKSEGMLIGKQWASFKAHNGTQCSCLSPQDTYSGVGKFNISFIFAENKWRWRKGKFALTVKSYLWDFERLILGGL